MVPPSFSSPGGGRFQSGSLRDSLWEWERMEGWGCPGTFYVKDSGGCYRHRHRVGSLSLTAASALFFFIYLECSAGSWQAGEAMLMTPAPRGHHSGGKKKLQCSLCHINQRNTSRAGCMETAFLVVPALHANHLPSWQ